MISSSSRSFILRPALLIGVVAALAASAHAGPSGPSARRAAQLKKSAPGWLSHYLPDDRYKIEGKVWKFVATDLDTYYHRPDSPNMLRQSADRVIGFASVKDAEEAGYKPDPTDGTASMAAISRARSIGASSRRIITLADGKSTIYWPPGWEHAGVPANFSNRKRNTTDAFIYKPKMIFLVVSTESDPDTNYAKLLTPTAYKTMLNREAAKTPVVEGIDMTTIAKETVIRSATWAGMKGITSSNPTNSKSHLLQVAKGKKKYSYSLTVPEDVEVPSAVREMLASFVPR